MNLHREQVDSPTMRWRESGEVTLRAVSGDVCKICMEECKGQWSHPDCKEHYFCRQCVQDYVYTKIIEANVLDIPCPGQGCKCILSLEQIQSLVDADMMTKYLRFKEHAELEQDPTVKWCPVPNCSGYARGSKEKPNLRCPVCKYQFCFLCGEKWHNKLSCSQVLDRTYNVWAKGREVQLCPRCKRRIEKDSGCNHMTCAACKYQWCWLCRGAYTSNHFNPLNPLGCGNLQSGRNTRTSWPLWRIYLRRCCFVVLFALCLPLLPFALVLLPAIAVTVEYHKAHRFRQDSCTLAYSDCFVCLFALALTPLGVVVAIPVLIVLGCVRLCRG